MLKYGDEVVHCTGKVGVITGVMHRGGKHKEYEVSFASNDSIASASFQGCELRPAGETGFGFKKDG